MNEQIHSILMLALLNIDGIGRKKAIKYYREYRDEIDSVEKLSVLIANGLERSDVEKGYTMAKKIIHDYKRNAIEIIVVDSARYPVAFYRLDDYPALLYCKGNMELLDRSIKVAVIGKRNPLIESQVIGRELVDELCKKDFVIVSGLALGIDSVAHTQAIGSGGKTIAILPSGIQKITPEVNSGLAGDIMEKDGLLISEYAPYDEPETYKYVERDRLQAGLSNGVFVVQTSASGGTMHAAREAIGLKIPVYVFQHDSDEDAFSGNRFLMEKGGAIGFLETKVIDLGHIKCIDRNDRNEQMKLF